LLSQRTKFLIQISHPVNIFLATKNTKTQNSSGDCAEIHLTLGVFVAKKSLGGEGGGEFTGEDEAQGASQCWLLSKCGGEDVGGGKSAANALFNRLC
jgi:hypothetical protein